MEVLQSVTLWHQLTQTQKIAGVPIMDISNHIDDTEQMPDDDGAPHSYVLIEFLSSPLPTFPVASSYKQFSLPSSSVLSYG